MKKMRNSQVQTGVTIQQMKQWWNCCNQSPSGRFLDVEHDYLRYSKVSLHWSPIRNGAVTPPIKYSLQGGLGYVSVEGRVAMLKIGTRNIKNRIEKFQFNLSLN